MNPITPKQFWDGIDRRGSEKKESRFTELSIESTWRPTDLKLEASEGFLRANGLVPDRRR
ncbi:MAG: hypothetical protein QM723_15575 [Myxococcaceae bacterium]